MKLHQIRVAQSHEVFNTEVVPMWMVEGLKIPLMVFHQFQDCFTRMFAICHLDLGNLFGTKAATPKRLFGTKSPKRNKGCFKKRAPAQLVFAAGGGGGGAAAAMVSFFISFREKSSQTARRWAKRFFATSHWSGSQLRRVNLLENKAVPPCLGGGFKYFLFSSLLGEDFQFDEHIFQMGWFNHQLVVFGCVWCLRWWMVSMMFLFQ